MRGTPETAPDWVIKALEEKEKEHAEACREEFRELRRASDTISDVRSRWTAHLEVEYESTTKSYRIVDLTLSIQALIPVTAELALLRVISRMSARCYRFSLTAMREQFQQSHNQRVPLLR